MKPHSIIASSSIDVDVALVIEMDTDAADAADAAAAVFVAIPPATVTFVALDVGNIASNIQQN